MSSSSSSSQRGSQGNFLIFYHRIAARAALERWKLAVKQAAKLPAPGCYYEGTRGSLREGAQWSPAPFDASPTNQRCELFVPGRFPLRVISTHAQNERRSPPAGRPAGRSAERASERARVG